MDEAKTAASCVAVAVVVKPKPLTLVFSLSQLCRRNERSLLMPRAANSLLKYIYICIEREFVRE